MPPDLDTLWTLVDQLDAEAECVTFYDALALVRAARPFEDLPKGFVADWVALHDAPHVTDGARTILGQYLQRLFSRQDNHRRLATQLIVLKDSGKTLRAAIGMPIAIALDARPQHGWVWQWETGPDCLQYDAMPVGTSPGDAGLKARYVLTPLRSGSGICRFEEVRAQMDAPPGVMPGKRSKRVRHAEPGVRRVFEIFVIVEDA